MVAMKDKKGRPVVVVTGLGVVTSLGAGKKDNWAKLTAGELLLVDFGLETKSGFCSDVTRVWPVSGSFTAEQKTIYELVLEVQRRAISKIALGVLWGDVHPEACRAFAEGLVSIGCLRGAVDAIVERGAEAQARLDQRTQAAVDDIVAA